jgi:hypothetical protein
MKIKNNILLATMALGGMSVLTSCLKDFKTPQDPSLGTNNVVEFQNISVPVSYSTVYPEYSLGGLSFVNDTAGWNIIVAWTGPEYNAPEDITVTLKMDTVALDAFNASSGDSYVAPPSDVVSFPTTVVIKKGTPQTIVRATATLASDYDFSASYALPLTISASSYGIISSNYGSSMYSFAARNKYDGLYTLTEKQVGWGAYGISDGSTYTWSYAISFVTGGQYANTIYTSDWGSLLPAFTSSGGQTAFGVTQPLFTFDGTTNALISVTNTATPDSRNRTLSLNTAVTDSRYDPNTGTIYAAFIMNQTGRPSQYFYDTLVYQGSR